MDTQNDEFLVPQSDAVIDTDAPMVRDVLFEGKGENDVLATLSHYLGFEKWEIEEKSRRHEVARARQIIMYLLREYAGMSFPSIGRLIGGRDHTTVIHGYQKIKGEVLKDPELENDLGDAISLARRIQERKRYAEEAMMRLKEEIQLESGSYEISRIRLSQRRKTIPDRNMKVLEMYREGLTLENIAHVFNLSRERVRQIVKSTIEQISMNESIDRGIVMDAEVLVEEESKKRKSAQESARLAANPVVKKEKRWSVHYSFCQSCGTTSFPHVKNGLCEKCLGSFRGERRENIISQHNSLCDMCKISRGDAMRKFGRDLYATRDMQVLCQGCFRERGGKRMGAYKKYEWSRSYPSCKSCHTTTFPNVGDGLCEECSDVISDKKRESLIAEHKNVCDHCGIGRDRAKAESGRDFCITKTEEVLCGKCFSRYALGRAKLDSARH